MMILLVITVMGLSLIIILCLSGIQMHCRFYFFMTMLKYAIQLGLKRKFINWVMKYLIYARGIINSVFWVFRIFLLHSGEFTAMLSVYSEANPAIVSSLLVKYGPDEILKSFMCKIKEMEEVNCE